MIAVEPMTQNGARITIFFGKKSGERVLQIAGCGVHGQTRGFIHCQQPLVFVYNSEIATHIGLVGGLFVDRDFFSGANRSVGFDFPAGFVESELFKYTLNSCA